MNITKRFHLKVIVFFFSFSFYFFNLFFVHLVAVRQLFRKNNFYIIKLCDHVYKYYKTTQMLLWASAAPSDRIWVQIFSISPSLKSDVYLCQGSSICHAIQNRYEANLCRYYWEQIGKIKYADVCFGYKNTSLQKTKPKKTCTY